MLGIMLWPVATQATSCCHRSVFHDVACVATGHSMMPSTDLMLWVQGVR